MQRVHGSSLALFGTSMIRNIYEIYIEDIRSICDGNISVRLFMDSKLIHCIRVSNLESVYQIHHYIKLTAA